MKKACKLFAGFLIVGTHCMRPYLCPYLNTILFSLIILRKLINA